MKQHLLKNTYAAIIALFIAMMALPTTAQAQTEYDLWICGHGVNSDNCNDLSVIDGVSGKVSYDPNTNTLTLNEATIKNTGKLDGIESRNDGLTIRLIGNNIITSENSGGIFNEVGQITFTGDGKLTVEGSTKEVEYRHGILSGGTIIVSGCTLIVSGGRDGLRNGRWKFDRCTVYAKGGGTSDDGYRGSITYLPNKPEFIGCDIIDPIGTYWETSNGSYYLFGANGKVVTDWVKIEPVTEYDLKICGTQVTSGNCGDLSVIDGVEGTVKYDPDNKTLTLEGAKLNAENCLWSEIDGLTIKVSGTNELNAGDRTAITIDAPTTITGGGTLNVKSQEHCGIYAIETNLTIKDCIVNAKGRWGIAGYNGSAEELLIKNATVTAEGKNGSICDFKEITLEDCVITQPAGAEFDESMKAVVLNGEVVTSEVKIVQTKYDLFICDTQVTSDNCGDLSGIDGVEGTVKYDPDSKTLTLEGAKLNVRINCISSKIDGLTIKVSGTNELNAEILAAVAVSAPATITGGGTLNVKSEEYVAICAYNETDLTIKDCIVNAKGKWGIAGQYGSEKLLISNATVRVEGENGSICSLKEITLEDCAITQPAGAVFDESMEAVVLNGKVVTSEVKIEPITYYALEICGTQVTSANCDDLSVIDGVEGTVKYEPESKTLTLENATIKNTKKEDYSSIGLYNAIDGLAIRLIGNNTISVEYNSGIVNRDGNALTLTGNGKLTVKSLAETSRYSIFNEGTITVRNCTLEASGWVGGLTSGYWKFDHCTVRVKGGGDSEHEDLGSINRLLQKPEFIGCAVIAPAGTYWKECEGIVGELYYSLFGADDKVVTDWVTIADPTSIHTPIVDTNTKQGIYTLSGVKLNGEVEDLPKGIYIVNGKKVVKK